MEKKMDIDHWILDIVHVYHGVMCRFNQVLPYI